MIAQESLLTARPAHLQLAQLVFQVITSIPQITALFAHSLTVSHAHQLDLSAISAKKDTTGTPQQRHVRNACQDAHSVEPPELARVLNARQVTSKTALELAIPAQVDAIAVLMQVHATLLDVLRSTTTITPQSHARDAIKCAKLAVYLLMPLTVTLASLTLHSQLERPHQTHAHAILDSPLIPPSLSATSLLQPALECSCSLAS